MSGSSTPSTRSTEGKAFSDENYVHRHSLGAHGEQPWSKADSGEEKDPGAALAVVRQDSPDIWEEAPEEESEDGGDVVTSTGTVLSTPGLVLKNLSQRVTVPSLRAWLQQQGFPLSKDCVTCIHVPCHASKGRARGYAIVDFANKAVARYAYERLTQLEFEPGRQLRVQPAWRDSKSALTSDLLNLRCPSEFVPVCAV